MTAKSCGRGQVAGAHGQRGLADAAGAVDQRAPGARLGRDRLRDALQLGLAAEEIRLRGQGGWHEVGQAGPVGRPGRVGILGDLAQQAFERRLTLGRDTEIGICENAQPFRRLARFQHQRQEPLPQTGRITGL